MKKIQLNHSVMAQLTGLILLPFFFGCEKVLVQNSIDSSYIEFVNDWQDLKYSQIRNKNFMDISIDAKTDTVWFPVRLTGLIPDHDSQIALQAFPEETLPQNTVAAVPGKDYVPFNDPSLAPLYILHAGDTASMIPVVLVRSAKMKQSAVQLTVEIAESPDLKPGIKTSLKVKISITDMYLKPANWSNLEYSLLGTYGVVKHDFLLKSTGKPFNEEFINILLADQGLTNYYKIKLPELLAAENANRAASGLPELREKADDPLTRVSFP